MVLFLLIRRTVDLVKMRNIALRNIVFVALFLCELSIAQVSEHADCKSAMFLEEHSKIIEQVEGHGGILEFKGNDLNNPKLFTEEHNTIWFRFFVENPAEINFSIIPEDPKNDWDFILFEEKNEMACEEIILGKLQPIRSNLARNDAEKGGKTGLSKDAVKAFEPAGVNPNFSKTVQAASAMAYLLVVDINHNQKKGFELTLDIVEDKPEIVLTPEPVSGEEFAYFEEPTVVATDLVPLQFEVYDEESNNPLKTEIEIIGMTRSDSSLSKADVSEWTVDVPKDQWIHINVHKEGYLFESFKIKSNEQTVSEPIKISLSKMKEGNKIVLKDIVFRENTTHMLPSSINAMEELLDFMKSNASAVVEIRGHVNAPGYENSGKVKKFSLKRAEEIKSYLVGEGIDHDRMKVKGMGNEFMIYPTPSTYEQEKANRRVEIVILEI